MGFEKNGKKNSRYAHEQIGFMFCWLEKLAKYIVGTHMENHVLATGKLCFNMLQF